MLLHGESLLALLPSWSIPFLFVQVNVSQMLQA